MVRRCEASTWPHSAAPRLVEHASAVTWHGVAQRQRGHTALRRAIAGKKVRTILANLRFRLQLWPCPFLLVCEYLRVCVCVCLQR